MEGMRILYFARALIFPAISARQSSVSARLHLDKERTFLQIQPPMAFATLVPLLLKTATVFSRGHAFLEVHRSL